MTFADKNRTRTTERNNLGRLASGRTQRVANHFCIGFYENRIVSILSFSFAGLMAEQVTSVGATALGLARSGDFKPLLHPFVRFLLRHGRNSLNFIAAVRAHDPTIPHPPEEWGGEYRRISTQISSDFFPKTAIVVTNRKSPKSNSSPDRQSAMP